MKVKDTLEFFQAEKHNMMIFSGVDQRKYMRKLALKFGVDYEPVVSN